MGVVAAGALGEIAFKDVGLSVAPDGCRTSDTAEPLAPWTYLEPGFLELERQRIFRATWQIACHQSDLPAVGDYHVFDMMDDSAIVIRGADGEIRAFANVCRHRGARLLDGRGRCPHRVTCPYHAWSYGIEGALKSVPFEDAFPDLDKSGLGLLPVACEIFHGFVFLRFAGEGPSVADHWGEMGADLAAYRTAEMVPLAPIATEVWDCNWKVAMDNYQESYHVPIGHPGLNRLVGARQDLLLLSSGVSRGVSRLRDKPSPRWGERLYQALAAELNEHLPEALRGEVRNYSMLPNLGLDLYPEQMDFFQLLPLGAGRTLVRTGIYGRASDERRLGVMRALGERINRQVNAEDRELSERVQRGLRTPGFRPGPLAEAEACIRQLHAFIRARIPAAALTEAPDPGTLRATIQ